MSSAVRNDATPLEGKSINDSLGRKNLLMMPYEILLNCFSYLDAEDLLNCSLVSSQCSGLASDFHLWKDLLYKDFYSSPNVGLFPATTKLVPTDSNWMRAFFTLYRLLHINKRKTGLSGDSSRHRSMSPQCPFCSKKLQRSRFDEASGSEQTGQEKEKDDSLLQLWCEACEYCIWTSGCSNCKSLASELVQCEMCSRDVCERCFGSAYKRCELCRAAGCRQCVRPLASYAEDAFGPSPSAAHHHTNKTKNQHMKKKSMKKGRSQQDAEGEHICCYCGVCCAMCGRYFEAYDTDYCVACQCHVCCSCDCPCGALDMFQTSIV